MANSGYQTASVYEYVRLLDKEEAENLNGNQVEAIKSSINKYMLHHRRAQTNAKLLENLLAD